MTEREALIETLWTYEVATEKVLKRSVMKGYITQEEADAILHISRKYGSLTMCKNVIFGSFICKI